MYVLSDNDKIRVILLYFIKKYHNFFTWYVVDTTLTRCLLLAASPNL